MLLFDLSKRKCSETAACGFFGSRATDHCEPCQVLTEAALSGTVGVPRGSLKVIHGQLFQNICVAIGSKAIGAFPMAF